jgi:hypothetical protein
MKLSMSRVALGAAIACGVASLGLAQIERLTLAEMVQKADGAVVGTIQSSKVFRVDHPVDGPELYFTTLAIAGRSLADAKPLTVEVTFPGGFITPDEGVWNSEAPSADEIRPGSEVVAFYKWSDNMGGGVASNALYASHGGLFQVAVARGAQVVLGKGDGYAVSANVELAKLEADVAKLTQAKQK